MELTRWGWVTMLLGAVCAGCGSDVVLGPVADRVRFTRDPDAMSGCTAVGQVNANAFLRVGSDEYVRKMQNEAVGLGGDAVLLTSGPAVGVAYRCKAAAPAAH